MDAILSMPWMYTELTADDGNARDGFYDKDIDNVLQEKMSIGEFNNFLLNKIC